MENLRTRNTKVLLMLVFCCVAFACVKVKVDAEGCLEAICCPNGTFLLRDGVRTSYVDEWGDLCPPVTTAGVEAGSDVAKAGWLVALFLLKAPLQRSRPRIGQNKIQNDAVVTEHHFLV